MGVIKNEKGEEFYTNYEYYEKRRSDEVVLLSVFILAAIMVLFFTMFYPYFNLIDKSEATSLTKQTVFFCTFIATAWAIVLIYRSRKTNIVFRLDRVGLLPIVYAFALALTVFIQSLFYESYGDEYSFNRYFKINIAKQEYIEETKDESSKNGFLELIHNILENK